MCASVATPPLFLPHVGESAIPFETWRKFFDGDSDAWPDARRRAVLLHCLGTEGQHLFYTLPDQGDMFDTGMAALEKHFMPKVHVVTSRHTFRQRVQRPDESVTQYIATLSALTSLCVFAGMESEMIRDQLIANANLSAVRDRLLLEDDLTLDKAPAIACQVESAVHNSTLLSRANSSGSAPVQAVGVEQRYSQGKNGAHQEKSAQATPQQPDRQRQTNGNQQRHHCFRCGSNKHLANDKNCQVQ